MVTVWFSDNAAYSTFLVLLVVGQSLWSIPIHFGKMHCNFMNEIKMN